MPAALKISIVYPVLAVAPFSTEDVACACAIGKLANRVLDVRIFLLLVRTWFVVVFMATGARARVGRVTIALNDLTIVRVTGYTPYVRIVVARIIQSRMTEVVGRRPALSRMTRVALRRGVKMTLWARWCLAGRVSTVVTRCATYGNSLVVKCTADESCGGMTVRAIPHSVLVNWVTRRPDCRISVVTGSAIVDDVGMIESHRDEPLGIMTGTTIQSGRRVWGGGRLSCG